MKYIWEAQPSEIIVQIDRPMSRFEEEPTWEECQEVGMSEDDFRLSSWKRLIRHPDDTKSHRIYIRPSGQGWDTPGNWGK